MESKNLTLLFDLEAKAEERKSERRKIRENMKRKCVGIPHSRTCFHITPF